MAKSDAPPLNATMRYPDWQVIAEMFSGEERARGGEGQTDPLGVFQVHLEDARTMAEKNINFPVSVLKVILAHQR